jgi:hypothetical protein
MGRTTEAYNWEEIFMNSSRNYILTNFINLDTDELQESYEHSPGRNVSLINCDWEVPRPNF